MEHVKELNFDLIDNKEDLDSLHHFFTQKNFILPIYLACISCGKKADDDMIRGLSIIKACECRSMFFHPIKFGEIPMGMN